MRKVKEYREMVRAIEQDNLHTIEKLIHKSVYTLGHQATQESFSEAFIQRIIGGSNG